MRWLPREHGGTVMAVGGFLAGWGHARAWSPGVVFVGLGVAGFLVAKDPAVLLARGRGRLAPGARREAGIALGVGLAAVGLAAAGALASLPWRDLARVAAVAGLPLAGALGAALARRDRTVWAELLGVLALSAVAAAGWLGARGHLGRGAGEVQLAAALFFAGALLHLRTMLRDHKAIRKGGRVRPERSAWWSVATTAAAVGLGAAGALPWGLVAAVGVGLLRPAVLRGPVRARPQRVGLAESALTLGFVLGATFL